MDADEVAPKFEFVVGVDILNELGFEEDKFVVGVDIVNEVGFEVDTESDADVVTGTSSLSLFLQVLNWFIFN